jgi:hypothetical protein
LGSNALVSAGGDLLGVVRWTACHGEAGDLRAAVGSTVGNARRRAYARLTQADRIAIVDILRATKPDLPAYFAAIGAAESASGAGSSR